MAAPEAASPQSGAIGAAVPLAILLRQLAQIPQFAKLLHALGKMQHLKGDVAAAVTLFEAAARQSPGFALAENDLGVVLRTVCRQDAALAAFDRAIAADPSFAPAHCNRGLLLLAGGRRADADASFHSVIALDAASALDWRNRATASQNLGLRDAAESAWRRALELDPKDGAARIGLARLLEDMHRPDEAKDHYIDWVRRQSLRVQRCIGGPPQARVLIIAATGMQNTPVHFLFPIERFETIAAYLLPPDHPEAAAQTRDLFQELPEFDIIFNSIGDADQGAEYLPGVTALCRRRPRPILNPPDAVPPTRRDRIGALLAGLPGLIVPPTRRLGRAELETLAGAAGPLESPALLRPAGSHGGSDLTRIERGSDIGDYLGRVPGDEHYLSEFWDYRSADGYFRKYRFAFIDREVFPYHLAIGPDWLVHYWRTGMSDAWMKREEEAFLADYEAVFTGAAAETVREVARRLDLDCAGMDCALTRDGRVLLFEANATMNLQLTDSRADFPYKHRYVPRIGEAVARMVRRRCAPTLP
jgi:tetratricopeptide (TPR) repeat protein